MQNKMKKFCSKCGNQLDLGKRNCTECNAFNPYFISGFTTTPQPEPESKLVEETITTNQQTQINEALLAEQAERERIELNLKNELLKVKQETEQYKRETLDLVKGVRKELQDIDNENKLLKEKVESLKSSGQAEQEEMPASVPAPPAPKAKPGSSKAFIAIAGVVLIFLIGGISYFALSNGSNKVTTTTKVQLPATTPVVAAEPAKKIAPIVTTDAPPTNKLIAAVTPAPAKPIPAASPSSSAPVPVAAKPANQSFSLTASRAIGDLVGKKLSGCDITINSPSEIDHLDNLVLVEKLSASYLKYKCSVKIKQGGETYTSSPYIYYSADGTFIKVDGTNCE
jgi:hypothetical protein